MPRMAKNNETPAVISTITQNRFRASIYIPRQSHSTPSPEKGAMVVVGGGDAENTIGRNLIGASRGGGEPNFFDGNPDEEKNCQLSNPRPTQCRLLS